MEKSIKELFARFAEEPSRERFKELLKESLGEQDFIDFKREWCEYSKIAKHILAIANSGDGCIVFGIDELKTGETNSVGLSSIKDKADISKAFDKYLPNNLSYSVLDFSYKSSDYEEINGKKFQVVIVKPEKRYMPYIAIGDGEGIKKNAIYCRRGTNSVEVNYEELQKIINAKIESGQSTTIELQLDDEVQQLKKLYGYISKYRYINQLTKFITVESTLFTEKIENAHYPKEGFEEFICSIIEQKKERIRRLIGLVSSGT